MTSDVKISDLRHRVKIEQQERVGDGAGGATVTWILVAEVWAGIWPRALNERPAFDRIAGTATHDIWMRYRTGIVPQMRIRFGSRVFDILGVMDAGTRRRFLKCVAAERDL